MDNLSFNKDGSTLLYTCNTTDKKEIKLDKLPEISQSNLSNFGSEISNLPSLSLKKEVSKLKDLDNRLKNEINRGTVLAMIIIGVILSAVSITAFVLAFVFMPPLGLLTAGLVGGSSGGGMGMGLLAVGLLGIMGKTTKAEKQKNFNEQKKVVLELIKNIKNENTDAYDTFSNSEEITKAKNAALELKGLLES